MLVAAWAAERAGDEAGNQTLLKRFLVGYPRAPELSAVLYRLAISFEASGDRARASETYRELVVLAPASDYAAGAADRLRALEEAGLAVPPLSDDQRLERANRLLWAGQVEAARAEAEAIVAGAAGPDASARGLELVGAALFRARQYDTAAVTFERAAVLATPERRAATWLEAGRARIRAGQNDRALAALAAVDERREPEAAQAALLRGLVLEEGGRPEAVAEFERCAERYPTSEAAVAARWRLGWIGWLGGDRQRALDQWSRIGALPAGQRYRLAAGYWSARALEELGHAPQAVALYGSVLMQAPRSYYGLLAASRVQAVSPPPLEPPALVLPADPRAALDGNRDVVRIELLRRLGLDTWMLAEMDELLLRSTLDPMTLYGLAALYWRDGRYDVSVRIARRYFADLLTTAHPALPQAFWEIAYPLGWADEVRETASRSGLDAFLVAAIIREESGFVPDARSRAGARGLMQVMPDTARAVAIQRGVHPVGDEALDQPGPNIGIGSAILADLLREFADPRLAIAAYNAGPIRVRQWWSSRRTDDVEAFLELIPYEETRLYVRRVVVAWDAYRRIYGGDQR
jgi:soluble lytic murein transglycosylase